MLVGIGQFANQSFGLPVRENAYQVEVTVKPTKKVELGVELTKTVRTKQLPDQ